MFLMNKQCIEHNDLAGISASKTMDSFLVEAGGYENVPFTVQDVTFVLKELRTLKLSEGDVDAIH